MSDLRRLVMLNIFTSDSEDIVKIDLDASPSTLRFNLERRVDFNLKGRKVNSNSEC